MTQGVLADRYHRAAEQLEAADQTHVLGFYEELDPTRRERLLEQIESVDWAELGGLIERYVISKPRLDLPATIEPAPWYPHAPTGELEAKYAEARALGEKLLRDGKVAAFTVAGGQGTRLGWDGPKGTFPATPIRQAPLFQVFAEFIVKAQRKYGSTIPWYIMTSPVNDAPTRAFLAQRGYFGLNPKHVMIFPQAMMPAMDLRTGKVLLAEPDGIALSPNGHGGSLKALWTSGAITDMSKRGIEQISYVQVDNPNVKVVDPLFIGLHALDGAQMSSKMLPKAYPTEKLGNFCVVNGKLTVIEYSDLPDELAEQRLPSGELRFRAGSIAIHVMSTAFVEDLNTRPGGFALPWHRAEKKVACVDLATGTVVEPAAPNAVKLETFVFDALPLCETSIVYETDRVEEFAPIKNAEGVDSLQTSRALQIERAARWLERAGVKVARDGEGRVMATIELAHLTAIEPADLGDAELPAEVKRGASLLL